MNVVQVNFSQHVVYPLFSDGTSVDETVKEVKAIECDDDEDTCWLRAPFPTIQAVRWCPKLRDGEGKPVLDENGEERRGVEGLFTLDNRRLYVLQRAAVLHHLKKFRTRTNGLSIFISEWNGTGRDNTKPFDVLRVWDWRSAVSKLEEGGQAEQAEAADAGNCGCWEYLDPRQVCRGPYSNWQMQQWWDHEMLPRDLLIRPFQPKGGGDAEGGDSGPDEEFRPVLEVFAEAPKAFAPGWSPEARKNPTEFHCCAQCRRRRVDGWSAGGQWYCANCWRKWQNE
eukprot:symbB.v1.2.031119.t1/scaffold3577.1/size53849/8